MSATPPTPIDRSHEYPEVFPPDIEAAVRRAATDEFLRVNSREAETVPTSLPASSPPASRHDRLTMWLHRKRAAVTFRAIELARGLPPWLRPGFLPVSKLDWIGRSRNPMRREVVRLAECLPGLLSRRTADNSLPALSPGRVRAILAMELGSPVADTFVRFDDSPLWQASFSQTHGAILANGRRVLVRVVDPTWRERLEREHHLADAVLAWLADELPVPVDEARRWATLFAGEIVESLTFEHFIPAVEALAANRPEPNPESTFIRLRTPHVLVTDDEPSLRALPALPDTLGLADREKLLRSRWRQFVTETFHHGVFNADPDFSGWAFVGNTCVYRGTRYVGRLSAEERAMWRKLLIQMATGEISDALTVAATLFGGGSKPRQSVEAVLRSALRPETNRRIGEAVAALALDAFQRGATLSSGTVAAVRALVIQEDWARRFLPSSDSVAILLEELRQLETQHILKQTVAPGGSVTQGARDYLSLLRGTFKSELTRLTGTGDVVSAAKSIAKKTVNLLTEPTTSAQPPAAPIIIEKKPAEPPSRPEAMSPPARTELASKRLFSTGRIAVLVGMVGLAALLFRHPNPAFSIHVLGMVLPLDAVMLAVLAAIQGYVTYRSGDRTTG